VFKALRCGTIAGGQLEHEFQGRAPAQVLRAAGPALVLLDAAGDVSRNACIKAAVRAAQDVKTVAQALPPLRASPSTRKAPTSTLARFSGVSAKLSASSPAPSSAATGSLNFSVRVLPMS
jgi:hypothetical protein